MFLHPLSFNQPFSLTLFLEHETDGAEQKCKADKIAELQWLS